MAYLIATELRHGIGHPRQFRADALVRVSCDEREPGRGEVVLELAELYRQGGRYWYASGYNVRALVAVAIGVIPVDALFTPVRRVNYKVSNTRVGQDTNYDRLDMEIWTDGTVGGENAVDLRIEAEQSSHGFDRRRPRIVRRPRAHELSRLDAGGDTRLEPRPRRKRPRAATPLCRSRESAFPAACRR